MSGDELVRVRGLSGGYVPGAEVLTDTSFTVEAGMIVAVLGPNGGGKTTLFRALLGELPIRSGHLDVHERPAYVPQTERARLDFPISALEVVLTGAFARTPWYRRVTRADRAAARIALERVGLTDRAGVRFGELSGGQRQRVLIARAITQNTHVLLLDEPLSGVDAVSAERIEAVLADLRAHGRAVLVATHDVAQARRWDRVLCLSGHQLAFGAPADVLTPAVLRATYGAELVVLDGGEHGVRVDHHAHAE